MYPSDIKDREWECIEKFFEKEETRGRKPLYPVRDIVNGILYVLRSGCQWRMMPNDLPPWDTVYKRFERWNKAGLWEKILDNINEKARVKQGRDATPSYAIIDSQSTKTLYASEERGIDGGKKGKGQKTDVGGRRTRKSTSG